MKKIYIINARNEKTLFSAKKVYRSAKRAGASNALAKRISRTISDEVYPGMKTMDIFKRVKQLLAKEEPKTALRFPLKEAMRRLGPTGFPFEKFIGEIYSRLGYEVLLNQEIPGHCCRFYEIDFIAKKGNVIYVGECKYRRQAGGKVHSDTALSNHARFLDIIKGKFAAGKKVKFKSLLVTNTKFTNKSVDYSECVGVELLGWNYPKDQGLENLIESQKLYPVTILPSLKRAWSDALSQKGMMLAEDILKVNAKKFSKKTIIPLGGLEKLKKEANILLD